MTCAYNRKGHELARIYSKAVGDDMFAALRWCRNCGAVVIDLDVDGRTTRPGGVMSMRFPQMALDASSIPRPLDDTSPSQGEHHE